MKNDFEKQLQLKHRSCYLTFKVSVFQDHATPLIYCANMVWRMNVFSVDTIITSTHMLDSEYSALCKGLICKPGPACVLS